jgi:cytochrome c oxidase cbb3-type subunit 4
MDIGTFHSIWTVIIFVLMAGVTWWAFSKKRKSRFDEDANMIFDEPPSNTDTEGEVK